MLDKVYEWINNNLLLIFILLFFLLLANYVDVNNITELESFATTLFTLIIVFFGFVILKDVISKWQKRQEEIQNKIKTEIDQSIKKEDKSYAYSTLNRLLERKEEIASGKYKMKDGLVVALNPSYTP